MELSIMGVISRLVPENTCPHGLTETIQMKPTEQYFPIQYYLL